MNSAENLYELGRGHGRYWHRADGFVLVDMARRGCRIAPLRRPGDPAAVASAMLAHADARMPGARIVVEDAYGVLPMATAGFEEIDRLPLMVRPPGPLGAATSDHRADIDARATTLAVRPGIELTVRIADTDHLAAHSERLTVDGMQMRGLQPWRPGVLYPPGPTTVHGWQLWLAELSGEPVGTCATQDDGTTVGIYGMTVLPSHQRRGVARGMLAAILARFADRWTCLASSPEGRRLYDSAGYRTVGEAVWWRRAAAPAAGRPR